MQAKVLRKICKASTKNIYTLNLKAIYFSNSTNKTQKYKFTMERIHTLINKLQQQLNNNESARQLLYTAQLLVGELSQQQEQVSNPQNVSVVMPSGYFTIMQEPTVEHNVAVVVEEKIELPEIEQIKIEEPSIEMPIVEDPQKIEPAKAEATRIPALPTLPIFEQEKQVFNLVLDETEEELAPTLILQKSAAEVNDNHQKNEQSVNDILKEEKKEVANSFVDTPIKDLRKAIGINDKYVFINELFKGDEAMYERSLKTINNFSVYPEAEQWIKRELFTKLCWLANSDTVEHFNQLIRRRFS